MKYKSLSAVVIIFAGLLFGMPFCSNLSSVYAEITVPDPGGTIPAVPLPENPTTSSITTEEPPADTTLLDTTSGTATETSVPGPTAVTQPVPEPTAVTQPQPEEPATNETTTQPEETNTAEETPSTPEVPQEPAMTMEEAIAEAKQQLTEPPPVYDLTNPGVVYGMLGEGVAAWKATLTGSPNEWGVDTNGAALSSTRPDVVPASLQTFLLGFYKDSPEIGLAFGLDGIASATQQLADAYNQSVLDLADKIIKDSEDGSVIEDSAGNTNAADDAAADDNNTPDVNDSSDTTVPESEDNSTTSEDVPEMTNNDNGSEDTTQKKVEVLYFGNDT